MKGIAFILILLGLLVTGYLVAQDLKAKRDGEAANIEAIEKASQVDDRLQGAYEKQDRRIKDLVGE